VGATGVVVGAALGQGWVVALAAIVLAGAVAREEWLVSSGVLLRRWRVGPLRWE
jgi:carbonic anhydrase/acetyltransferase-like protein (isoleucine patch superfamily)